jgi:hypothetical protein
VLLELEDELLLEVEVPLELEVELLEEDPVPEELLLVPGVIPPLEQPCKAIALAATKIKAIFFILTILSK